MKKITIDLDIITVDEVDFDSIVAFRDISGDIFVLTKKSEDKEWMYSFTCITSKTINPVYVFENMRTSIREAAGKHDVLAFKDQFEFAEWMLSFKIRLHGIDTNVKS